MSIRFLKKIPPEAPLRIGLAGTFLWSGFNIFTQPENWSWALQQILSQLPISISNIVTETIGLEIFLKVQGATEMFFAVILLLWFIPRKYIKYISFFLFVELALILSLVGIDTITFRDMGLLGAIVALIILSNKRYR